MAATTAPAFNPNAAYSPASTSTAPAFNPDAAYAPSGSTQAPSTPDSGILNKIGEFGAGIVPGAVEGMSQTVQSLPFIGKHIISPEAMQAERAYFAPGSPAEKAGQIGGEGAESVLEFVLGDEALKGLALADKIGLAGKITKIAQDSPYIGKLLEHGVKAARVGTVGAAEAAAKGATPGAAIATGVATGVGGELLSAAGEAIPKVKNFLSQNPFRQIVEGKGAAQVPAEAAIREVAGAGASEPILQGSKTVLDDPLSALGTKEKAAYKAVDDAAGFDVKEAKLQLKNDQYAIQQLGNTEADQASRIKLKAAIDDATARIGKAETRLSAAGIDPKAADALHTSRMAGTDFKNSLVRSTAPDGTINVDKLLNQSKVLRFSKRGDRLAQFMGKAGADAFMTQLEAAQKAGVAAVKTQQIAKWIGVKVLQGAGLAAGAEGVKSLLD